jgi:predicted nucleotidyltransferase component of viral defense system
MQRADCAKKRSTEMTIDLGRQSIIYNQILQELFRDDEISAQLIFKGGTCLMLFYGLDRFSTDLDFDLRDGAGELNVEKTDKILRKYLDIKDSAKKANTYFWSGSYERGMQKIKIEINRRKYPQSFDIQDLQGVSIPTMSKGKMLSHKLCAITDRRTIQNRDLYDANFMLHKALWEPDEEIIRLRTGMDTTSYYRKIAEFIDSKEIRKDVLFGMGEILDDKQKTWVKNHLVDELKSQLLIRISATN